MSQYHFHFYGGGPSGPQNEGIVVSTTPTAQDARLVRSLSHPPPRAPLPLRNVSPRPATAPPGQLSRDRSPHRERSPRHERSPRRENRSRSRRQHRRHHHTRRPEPAETQHPSTSKLPGPPAPRPATAPPGLLHVEAPRPRPTLSPAIRMVSAPPPVLAPSPERPPGQWTPASSQRPVSPRPQPPPHRAPTSPEPAQVLQQAADVFRSQAASSANAPAASTPPHSVAPVTPSKNPPVSAKGPQRRATPSPMDDEPMLQATHRSTYEQLLDQISRRAKGRNAVDYYEEGLTPLLAYMFFVLRSRKFMNGRSYRTAQCVLIVLHGYDSFLCQCPGS